MKNDLRDAMLLKLKNDQNADSATIDKYNSLINTLRIQMKERGKIIEILEQSIENE